jgi:hypothetical protein
MIVRSSNTSVNNILSPNCFEEAIKFFEDIVTPNMTNF